MKYEVTGVSRGLHVTSPVLSDRERNLIPSNLLGFYFENPVESSTPDPIEQGAG